jgi:hypothetical protein
MFGYGFLLLGLLGRAVTAQQIVNGQIYTPGIAIVDAPQPNTPLGGGKVPLLSSIQSPLTLKEDFLQVALDVSSDGQLQLPPYPSNSPTEIFNITIFLSSYTTGKNFTISNGTATANNASLGEIMEQESSSTVKHVNWFWPDCLVGNGPPSSDNSSRGLYNVGFPCILFFCKMLMNGRFPSVKTSGSTERTCIRFLTFPSKSQMTFPPTAPLAPGLHVIP